MRLSDAAAEGGSARASTEEAGDARRDDIRCVVEDAGYMSDIGCDLLTDTSFRILTTDGILGRDTRGR